MVGLACSIAYLIVATPLYTATAVIFVSTQNPSSALDLAQGNSFTEARVQSYVTVAQTSAVTDPVVSKLHSGLTSAQLAGKISATAPINKVIIYLSVTDEEPSTAKTLADAVAAQFKQTIQELESTGSGSSASAVKLTIAQPAPLPHSPTAPNKLLSVLVGLVVGLALGVLGAVIRHRLDRSASASQIEAIATSPILTVVPWDRSVGEAPIAVRSDLRSQRAEAFRRLRTNLQFLHVDSPPRIIAVTSALPAEGKSHCSINLAATLADAGSRVCLMEADLRKPSIARLLGLVGDVGLTQVLSGQIDIADVMQQAGDNLLIVTSGPLPPNPTELLISAQMKRVLENVAAAVDYVILDTAPLLPVTDGAETAALADTTLLSVRAGRTTQEQVHRAVQALRNVDVQPSGVVLSMVSTKRAGTYGAYYYYGSYGAAPNTGSASTSARATSTVGSGRRS